MKIIQIKKVDGDDEVEAVRKLFYVYANYLKLDLDLNGLDSDFENLPGEYSPPNGCLFLATYNHNPAGCVGLRKHNDCGCEIKRLFVLPKYRGLGIGRSLAKKMIEIARKAGYKRIQLDTISSLIEAISLYLSLGFVITTPDLQDSSINVIYMELSL
ncbi:MAG: GNAT family N-acetyltransferase [Aliifodinibius sp.]|nr:GNAT family N-acetyltransferase [candidate division Zixibacteria bacterium]NIT59231.1 GNAT family N-acetyltransferase [Fodinibius sp.]NIW40492.1 GNAT family N-acetyltransferase [candidate division Zixibacteria bacterium]NIX57815.1 GNAT family N-acetyltransferase [candidate division Zixibacteria bacterium]NIY27814.1 GNAT family N-acetyltransferase [Fodinibius sp.]